MNLNVRIKQPGHRKNQLTQTCIHLDHTPRTVRELLELTVRACVRDTLARKDSEAVVLTGQAIADAASAGKIGFGLFYGKTDIDEQQAVSAALESFSDGLIALFIDNDRKEHPDEPVSLSPQSVVTFIRLTMLTGRLW